MRGQGAGAVMGRITSQGALLLLCACGGGSGVSSTPTPTNTSSGSTGGTPTTPVVNYDTAEYRRSTGAVQANALSAYNAGASGAGVTVGVIDSGVSDPTGELTGRISSASRDFAGNSSYTDTGGHGTQVTMALAAARNDVSSMGIAWGATVLALRTDQPGSCADTDGCKHSESAIASALDYAVSNRAKVVNISLGGSSASSTLLASVSRATAAGTIIVIAGGNDATAAPDPLAQSLASSSVSHGLVIIAEALDGNNARASFANGAQGYESVTLGALGVNVRTIDKNGNGVLSSGSSLSTPLIAGAAALLAQAFPNLTSAQIVQLLLTSARDAGATGADAEYGAGILDLSRAFAPQGSLSLAGSTTVVSGGGTGALSSAMGDAAAASQSFSSVATDTLGRAYQVTLGSAMQPTSPALDLAPALDLRMQTLSGVTGGGTGRVSLSLAPSPMTAIAPQLGQQPMQLASARFVSQLVPGMTLALGFRAGEGSLRAMMGDGMAEPAFLVARNTGPATAEFRPDRGMRLHWRLARGLNLAATSEMGRVGSPRRPDVALAPDQGRYDSMGMGVEGQRGPLAFALGATWVTETRTALGARFIPLMGAQSGRTLFADARLGLDSGGWVLGGAWRRGWTRAAAGGVLRDGGSIVSEAWNITGGRHGLFRSTDRLDLRLSQPLRVIGSAFPLTLPTGWDYLTGTATTSVQMLDLRPRGRERIVEAAYGAPLGQGWLSANVFRRADPGNIAAMPAETGGAMRYSLTF